MPPYPNLPHFMRLVRAANQNYERHKQSALHGIVANLSSQNPNPQTVQALIAQLPDAKKQKYTTALTYLRTDFVKALPAISGAPPQLRQVTQQQQTPAAAGLQIAGGAVHDATGGFHGWTEITNLNQLPGGAIRAGDNLNAREVMMVTGMLRSVEDAIESSLKNLRSTVPGVDDAKTALFEELFGPCTTARLKTVRNNYEDMKKQLFGFRGQNATGLAVLNEARRGNTNFAETYRRSVWRPTSGHIALILGSGFFRTAQGVGMAFRANDFTIGTLIHEFSHACCDASDVPVAADLQANLVLDANGFPPRTSQNCVDGVQDRQMVAWIFARPWPGPGTAPSAATAAQRTQFEDYPLQNADAYGQYSLECFLPTLKKAV